MCVVSDEAAAVGVTAVPTPMTSVESDLWYVHEQSFDTFRFGDQTGAQSNTGRLREIDSKAMRKVEEGQDVVLVLQNSAQSDGTISSIGGRMLVKVN